MKQIIYLGGKKAREYDGVDEPKFDDKYFEERGEPDYSTYKRDLATYKINQKTLPVFDVIGDCDWKEGDVKTKDVDYKVKRKSRHEFEDSAPVSVIVPIPKKQEGEEELAEMPKPIGDFILNQDDIIPLQTTNGAYYHYSHVCVLIKRAISSDMSEYITRKS